MLKEAGRASRIRRVAARNREDISELRIELAVIHVRFEHLLAGAVGSQDLETLESKIMAIVDAKFAQFGESVSSANAQQTRDILGEVRNLFDAYRASQKDAQLESQTAVLAAIKERRSRWLWWVLGIVAALIVSVASGLFGLWIAGAFN